MSASERRQLRMLEGAHVHLALHDGSRMDEVALVSAGRTTIWVFANGEDRFVPTSTVVEVWEARRQHVAA